MNLSAVKVNLDFLKENLDRCYLVKYNDKFVGPKPCNTWFAGTFAKERIGLFPNSDDHDFTETDILEIYLIPNP